MKNWERTEAATYAVEVYAADGGHEVRYMSDKAEIAKLEDEVRRSGGAIYVRPISNTPYV